MISKKERWLGALTYLFELGYLLGWNHSPKSSFLRFHFEEASKLIIKLVFPALALILLALFMTSAAQILLIAAAIILILYLLLSFIAAANAWKGNTKKML